MKTTEEKPKHIIPGTLEFAEAFPRTSKHHLERMQWALGRPDKPRDGENTDAYDAARFEHMLKQPESTILFCAALEGEIRELQARLGWFEDRAFTAYRHRDPEDETIGSFVLVDEDAGAKHGRRGKVGKTLAEAITQP